MTEYCEAQRDIPNHCHIHRKFTGELLYELLSELLACTRMWSTQTTIRCINVNSNLVVMTSRSIGRFAWSTVCHVAFFTCACRRGKIYVHDDVVITQRNIYNVPARTMWRCGFTSLWTLYVDDVRWWSRGFTSWYIRCPATMTVSSRQIDGRNSDELTDGYVILDNGQNWRRSVTGF